MSRTILPMSLLRFCAVISLLSMEGQRALRFHQKYLTLCSEDEQRSYGFGTTWGWVINDRSFIFGWTNPLNKYLATRLLIDIPSTNNLVAHSRSFLTVYKFFFFLLIHLWREWIEFLLPEPDCCTLYFNYNHACKHTFWLKWSLKALHKGLNNMFFHNTGQVFPLRAI